MKRLLVALLILSCGPTYSQKFQEFLSLDKSIFEKMLNTYPELCPMEDGKWVNSMSQKPGKEFKGKFTILHFGSFDNFASMSDIESLAKLQKEYPQIRVIISLNPKFLYPQNKEEIEFELEKRQINLPVYFDESFDLWSCMNVEYWPTTMFVDPRGRVIETHEGSLEMNQLKNKLPLVLSRLQPRMEPSPEMFYGFYPNRWNPRTVLEYPAGLAIDEREQMIFVSDYLGNRVLGLTVNGNVIYCIGTGGAGGKDGTFDQSNFKNPRGLAFDAANKILYVADVGNHKIRRVDLINEKVTTLIGNGRKGKPGQLKIIDGNGSINSPVDLLLEGTTLYIAMAGTSEIWKYDTRTKVAERIGGTGDIGFADGDTGKALLAAPLGLSNDPSGVLFFTDAQSSSLRYLEDGKVKTAVGKGLFDYGYSDGRKENIKLQYPSGITSLNEKIIIADTYNHCIREVEPFAQKSSTLAGNAKLSGYRNGFEPLFHHPMDVAKLRNEIVVADAGNGSIRILNPSSGECRSVALVNYGCLGRGEGNTITDLRDGEILVLGDGLNEITYRLDFGEEYELDPTAFIDVNLKSRHPGIELTDSDLSDGSVTLKFMPNPEFSRPMFTLEFSLFLRSTDKQNVRQLRKEITFAHRIEISDKEEFSHQVTTTYNPEIGRE